MLLGPPPEMRQNCRTLSVFRDNEHGQTLSWWVPDAEDLRRLQEGSGIWLYIVGAGHSPVWLSTESPWENRGPVVQN